MAKARLVVAVAILAGAVFVPARAALPDGDDLTDQAATFAVRAVAHAGLLDPLGQYYGYDGIVRYEDRWIVAFRTSTCHADERVETCDPNAGSRDEPVADAWLEVVTDGDRFAATDAFGRFTAEQEDAVRSYDEPATVEESHLEFPTVRVDKSADGGWEVRAANLWAGPLPAPGVWSVCKPVVFDAAGDVLWTGTAFAERTRRDERSRSGGIFGAGRVELRDDPDAAVIACELWTAETWTLARAPEVRAYPHDGVARVEARLTWEHEPLSGMTSACRVDLFRRDGKSMGSEVVRGPISPWGGRPEKETLGVIFDVRRPRAAAVATVECRAAGQL